MAAVAVLPPSGTKTVTEEHMEVDAPHSAAAAAEEDLYTRLKTLQRQLEFLEIQVHALGIHGSQQMAMLYWFHADTACASLHDRQLHRARQGT